MGNKLNHEIHELNPRANADTQLPAFSTSPISITPIPWLDEETERYLRHALTLLIERRDDVQAAVLYGSVARRGARPLDDPDPSDVDVLILFTPEAGLNTVSMPQRSAVAWAIVDVIDQYPGARELEFMPTLSDLARWDNSFIENVAHDGILLWARGSLPDALHALEEHQHQAPVS